MFAVQADFFLYFHRRPLKSILLLCPEGGYKEDTLDGEGGNYHRDSASANRSHRRDPEHR